MRRSISTKLRVFWSREEREYVALVGVLPGVRGIGQTAEKALLELSMNMQEYLDEIIEKGNTI